MSCDGNDGGFLFAGDFLGLAMEGFDGVSDDVGTDNGDEEAS